MPTKYEIEKRIATFGDPKSNGAWAKFVRENKEAEKKDAHLKKLIKHGVEHSSTPVSNASAGSKKQKIDVLTYIEKMKDMYEPKFADQKIFKNNINNKVATKPTEEGLFEVYLQMIKAGELLPNTSFRDFEKNYPNLDIDITKKRKKPTSPVEIDFSLDPTKTAFIGLWPTIKDSTLYKLLDNPQVLGTELSHESIVEIINLLNRSGLLKDGGKV